MAEEEIVAAPEAAAAENQNKRKLEELVEPLDACGDGAAESEVSKELQAENGDNDADDASEAKRPRLDGDGHAAENGYQKHKEVDEPNQKVEQSAEDGHEESKEVSHSVPREQPGDEEKPSIEDEKCLDETAQEPNKQHDDQEPPADASQQKDEQQPVDENETLTRRMEVPNNKVGVLIGKAGDTIRYLQYNSGARIQITRDAEADPRSSTRPVELIGTSESINKAEKLIKDVIAEADAGGSPALVARGFSTVQAVTGEQLEIQVANEKVGLIIGKGGETIKNLQTKSGARIQLIPQHPPEGDQSKERTVRVTGDHKQIEMAREMIMEVMNQMVRPSPLSGGYGQPGFRPRGPVAPQWGPRGGHHAHYAGYDQPQRGAYPSQSQQYPPPSYGNYPPQAAPRNSYGPSWEQRPPMQGPPPQAHYNYGQPQVSEYGQPPPYSQSYGHGYSEGHGGPQQQPYGGYGVSQQTNCPPGGPYPGYGPPQDQYGKLSSYGVPPQAPHAQPYGQSRPTQPGEVPYQGTMTPTQSYGPSVPPQQSYPYASSGPMQQSYPAYGSAPAADGYSQPQPATATGPTYTQQSVPPVSGYAQPGAQQPAAYGQVGAAGGYSAYPSQPGYTEQSAATNAGYGYQGQVDTTYATNQGTAGYVAQPTAQAGYTQPAATQQGYDQSAVVSGGYATAAAPAAHVKSASPQPGFPQYDASQMYGAPR